MSYENLFRTILASSAALGRVAVMKLYAGGRF
jgi:hypothetical protein